MAQAGTLAGRTLQPLNHLCLLFVRLLTVLQPCATAHIVAPAWLPFQGSWSGTTNALAALRAASSPQLELQTPVTVLDNRSVSSICQKIVSICIFGNGNVCLINLCVTATQSAL